MKDTENNVKNKIEEFVKRVEDKTNEALEDSLMDEDAETENYDTLSGYLIEKLGHIPEKDDRDTVLSDNLVFTVEEVRDNLDLLA